MLVHKPPLQARREQAACPGAQKLRVAQVSGSERTVWALPALGDGGATASLRSLVNQWVDTQRSNRVSHSL